MKKDMLERVDRLIELRIKNAPFKEKIEALKRDGKPAAAYLDDYGLFDIGEMSFIWE